jgi:hypothetical protein
MNYLIDSFFVGCGKYFTQIKDEKLQANQHINMLKRNEGEGGCDNPITKYI